ncbi:MAG TPA: glycosyltransferase family 4 protein [Syntrophomonadaceae bacterium]|nr:glycosyltransferase family 4 protein [Syntrophomonadaceae bacterium]
MFKIGVCGCFSYGHDALDGQVVKTRTVTKELENQFDQNEIQTIDTTNWRKNKLKITIACLKMALQCKNIIIIAAQNGISVLIPLFTILSKIFGNKVHYCVVGGWLPEFLESRPALLKSSKKLDSIHAETFNMIEKLKVLGLEQVYYLPVFKHQKVIEKQELPTKYDEPYRFCTFSRVIKEKGIEDAINAIKTINDNTGYVISKLDIYGQVADDYKEQFQKIIEKSPPYIKYAGIIETGKIVETLSTYYCLLFPTYYPGEGFPATLLDSMMAGLPAIVSDWRYNIEIVQHGKTGLLYSLDNSKNLIAAIQHMISNPEEVIEMKYFCITEANRFLPSAVITNFIKMLS